MANVLREKSTEIISLTSILLVVIGVVGFAMTICQLNVTQKSLKASNAYQIQRDARNLIGEVSKDGLVSRLAQDEELNEGQLEVTRQHLWKMFNFYLAVYRQEAAGGISEAFSDAFREDFCSFASLAPMSAQWEVMVKMNMLSEAHSSMKEDWCETT